MSHAHAHQLSSCVCRKVVAHDPVVGRLLQGGLCSTPRACLVLELKVELLDDGAHLDQDFVWQQLVLLLPDAVVLSCAQVPG